MIYYQAVFVLSVCSPSFYFVAFVVQRVGLTTVDLLEKSFLSEFNEADFFTVPWLGKKLTQNPQCLVFFNSSHDYSPCKSGISLLSGIFLVSVNMSQSTLFPLHSAHFMSVSSSHVVFNFTAIQCGYADAQ